MDILFGSGDNVLAETSLSTKHNYTAEEIALMLGALGAMVASIIYSIKNVKHSSCCYGVFNCDQRTVIPARQESIRKEHLSKTETEV